MSFHTVHAPMYGSNAMKKTISLCFLFFYIMIPNHSCISSPLNGRRYQIEHRKSSCFHLSKLRLLYRRRHNEEAREKLQMPLLQRI